MFFYKRISNFPHFKITLITYKNNVKSLAGTLVLEMENMSAKISQ